MISTSKETYSTKNLLKVGRLGALAKPFVPSEDQLSFLLHLLSISYFHSSPSLSVLFLALAHLQLLAFQGSTFSHKPEVDVS